MCLTQGRRQFKDIEQDFKSKSEFVLGLISQVYANDQHCKDVSLSPEERLQYMHKHRKGLTAFLRHPGAPLDNNILEQELRIPVLNRKNFLFFKGEYGAFVGDILLSIIETCDVNKVNAFDYMVAIQKYFELVRSNPDNWMPWNSTHRFWKQSFTASEHLRMMDH